MKIKIIIILSLVFILFIYMYRRFPDNSKKVIVAVGDSITNYGNDTDGYVTILRKSILEKYPEFDFYLKGIGKNGAKVGDLEDKLLDEVINLHPNIVIIYIGINDVWHSLDGKGTSIDEFEVRLRQIISKIKAINSEVILCTPSVIGEKIHGQNRLDKMLDDYSDVSRAIAHEMGVKLVDLRKIFIDYLKINNYQNISKGILTTDGVHLDKNGNKLVAEHLLNVIFKNE